MAATTSVEAAIERWGHRLERVCDRIHHCTVTVERERGRPARKPHFHVWLDVALADDSIVVARTAGHADVYVAVSDAFRASRRRLADARGIRPNPDQRSRLAPHVTMEAPMKTDSTRPDSDDDEGLDDAAQGVRVSPEDADDSSSEIDEIGQAAGLVTRDDRPFRGIDEVDRRDQHRWELDPDSAEQETPIYRPNQ